MITGCLPCRAAAVRIRVKYLTPLETRTAKNQRAFANRRLTIPRGGWLLRRPHCPSSLPFSTTEASLGLEAAHLLGRGWIWGPEKRKLKP